MNAMLLRHARIAAAMLAMAVLPAAHACINSVSTDHTGQRFYSHEYVGAALEKNLTQPVASRYWIARSGEITQRARSKPDLESLTDLGIVLIYHGRHDAAVRLFLHLEKRYPGRAETAANLGTALELAGHDDTALKWIRIGMRRNPEEHRGTEWLHARILEAKIGLARNPAYLQGRSVAGLRFDTAVVPALPRIDARDNAGGRLRPYDVHNALAYQLHERLAFVRPPDPVVANLLHDWATLNLAGGPIENAEVLYRLAARYGAQQTALMAKRLAHVRKTLRTARKAPVQERSDCALCLPPPSPPPDA